MRPLTLRHIAAAVVVIALVLPASSLAGFYFHLGFGLGCGGCGFALSSCLCPPCASCHHPPAGCVCPPPAAPVLPPVSYVPRTEIHRQAYIEQVPVTTYEQVTQTVYVPHQITRTVPRTVMTQQTRFRDVAVQTMQPTLQPFTPVSPAIGCNSCGSSHFGYTPAPLPGTTGVLPTATPTSIAPAAIPTMPTISVSPYAAPTPVPQYDDVNWTDVRPRATPTPSRTHTPIRGTSLFRPAPSAAAVWQSRF